MSKFHEINSLIIDYLEGDTNLTPEEIEARCYEYYLSGNIEPTGYDYLMAKISDLIDF